jgi:hypothetical protein
MIDTGSALNLGMNIITDDGVLELVKGLRCVPTLESLLLDNDFISDYSANALADWLGARKSIS